MKHTNYSSLVRGVTSMKSAFTQDSHTQAINNLILTYHGVKDQSQKAIVLYSDKPDYFISFLLDILHKNFSILEQSYSSEDHEFSVEYFMDPNIWKLSSDHCMLLQIPQNNMDKKDQDFLENAKKIVLHHLGDDTFNYRILARHLYLSVSHLNKRLNSLIGQSSNEFIRAIRLEHSKYLLLTTNDRVKEIGYATGFPCLTRFDQAFKAYFGHSPSYCRTQNQTRK